MELKEMKLTGFMDVLASSEATPGGGGAAAVVGAEAAALCSMVLSLTINDDRYKAYVSECIKYKNENEIIRNKFLDMIEEDKKAFETMVKVFAMPKTTEKEIEYRKEKMQESLKICAKPPYELIKLSLDGLKLLDNMKEIASKNAISDVGCAAVAYMSCVDMSFLNVKVNVDLIKDIEYKDNIYNDVNILVKEIDLLYNSVYKFAYSYI